MRRRHLTENLLLSLTPHEAIYFIDCDAMRINGVSALRQVETPGWDIPAGEELATIYSDTYKLGLLALRLLAGDHHTKNPHQLPGGTPSQLRQIITDTLTPAKQSPTTGSMDLRLGPCDRRSPAPKESRSDSPCASQRHTRTPIDTRRPFPAISTHPTIHTTDPDISEIGVDKSRCYSRAQL